MARNDAVKCQADNFLLPLHGPSAPTTAKTELPDSRHTMIVNSVAMREVLEQAGRVAGSKVSVLLAGESGTGKELLARWLHKASPRASQPLVCLNCAALSEALVESELFGHEKGAFTGADESRAGCFERAHGGTLLLDEVSEISCRLQAKLLRVLEEEQFERVGGVRTLQVDVRVIATTNRCLEEEIAQERFRPDLFYRLNAVQLLLPPLRSRREEIPALIDFYFNQYRQERKPPLQGIAPATQTLLAAYDWPGNVRQLRNVVRRSCLLGRGPYLQPEDLPPLESPTCPVTASRWQTLAEIERQVILATLQEENGNKTTAAARLGVTSRTLWNKLNKYRQAA